MFVDRSRFIEVAGVLRELQLCLGSQGNRRRFLYSWFEDEGVEMSSFPHHSMRSLERFAQGVRSEYIRSLGCSDGGVRSRHCSMR